MRSALPGDVLVQNSAVSTTLTGSWVAVNNRAIPLEGIPLVVELLKGVGSGGSVTVVVAIQDSDDASTVKSTVWTKTYTVTTGGNSFEDDPRIFSNSYYLRATITITGTLGTAIDAFVGVVTGDIM